jgi:hypothetical protein
MIGGGMLGYKIASVLLFAALAVTWYASLAGWGLSETARTTAQSQAVHHHRSVRYGSMYHLGHYYGGGYGGGGSHFGK